VKDWRALVTAGPTHEAIDPVRYIANRSSGKQGFAIARALSAKGVQVILISGPTNLPDPPGITTIRVESAHEMLQVCQATLPVDIAVFCAAVVDWRVETVAAQKIKKTGSGESEAGPVLTLVENPDILKTISAVGAQRPRLCVGFAAETENVVENATTKRRAKGCDWILANDVSPASGTFGGDSNTIHLITEAGVENWQTLSKAEIGVRLADRLTDTLAPARGNSVQETAR
jgi:phosphopantothenoylcysteine decarboxylase/phosphopantothenate--cysteine ligase